MAHELTTREDGTVEMAYAGALPWHGLGNELQHGATIEEWIAAAGMEWHINRARVRYATERNGAVLREYDGNCVLFRDDSKAPLGIVSDAYKVVQPKQVLEFFRDLTGAAGFTLETAGTLFGGKRFWALASIGKDAAIVDPRDKVKAHLLLSTACDGSMSTEGRYVTTRVVCNNTLTMARGEGAASVRVNHKSKFDARTVQQELGIETAFSAFDRTIAAMRRLAQTPLSSERIITNTVTLLHPTFAELDSDHQVKILKSRPVEAIGRLAMDGTAMGAEFDGAKGTSWGWLNAVTQYIDHSVKAQTIDNRINSAWFGPGANVKTRAYEMAMADGTTAPAESAVDSVRNWLAGHGASSTAPEDRDAVL